ncbi:RNA polymerase sigma factor [Clostridium massiliamazoniense]|uniref:RNA polymerase sigma factor n=1 Tax=Clostridium massiliamazoniense TaxID=1347366 RepID=UPI00241C55D9|nr:sigma-70 family RNA polymerase sigma factor [Clostridium massiliamazoniense]
MKDKSLSEDITQEIFIDVINGIRKLKNIEAFDSWLKKITLNKINMYLRNLIKHKNIIHGTDVSELTYIKDKNLSQEDLVIQEDYKNLISKFLNKLSEKEKEVVSLFYYDELSLKEISIINNIPIGTVKSRLFSAKKKLSFFIKNLAFSFYKIYFYDMFSGKKWC